MVGSGRSASHRLIDRAGLGKDEPETQVHWTVRRALLEEVLGRGSPDALPERARLATGVGGLMAAGALIAHTGLHVDRLDAASNGVSVFADGELVVAVSLSWKSMRSSPPPASDPTAPC